MDFNLSTHNIGPLREFSSKQQVGSCKIGIFANNGSGKTFLSRMFWLASSDEHRQEQLNNLLTINEQDGHFLFELKNPAENGRIRKLSINVTRNASAPIVKNDTGYLFHVFNSDYVHENIEVREYAPDGNIEGYILGKGNIDLSKEKREQALLEDKQRLLIEVLKAAITKERQKLDNLGIRKNLSEHKDFRYDNFTTEFKVKENLSFSLLTEFHNDLKAIPDDLPDIIDLPTLPNQLDFNEINELLKTSYLRSNLAEEFVKKIKKKQAFIEQGLQFDNKSKCPFCEQAYSEDAADLIRKYNDYLFDEEAKIAQRCQIKINELKSLQKQIKKCVDDTLRSLHDFDKKKKYIPSMRDVNLTEIPSVNVFSKAIETLCRFLEDKTQQIDKVAFDINDSQHQIDDLISEVGRILATNDKIINEYNSKKNNTQNEKRELDRRLSRALFLETKSILFSKLESLSSQEKDLEKLRLDIEEREAQVRVERRKRVADSLTQFLDLFFGGKYSFDKKKFHITFEGKVLGQKIASVLSEGEKSIVAFCHYLAETHVHLHREEDYKKLFFIIDDPISSLDFHYVYAVTQVIRRIDQYFDLKGHPRFMVLTHNIEFMSILIRNKIVQQRFVLSGGKLGKLNEHLILPYEAHLRDIHAVARRDALPKHTTPNSIRHVLETISRFESPDAKFEDYFEKCEELQGDEFIYSLMHDGSHGTFRTDKAYTDDMIRRGCEAVIKFIENKFEGQISHVATP
jgi:hypothetical protein